MYYFDSTRNEREYFEKVKTTIALLESLLEYCLDEAYKKANDIINASGIFQSVKQRSQEAATKAVLEKLAQKGVEVATDNNSYGEIAGALTRTGTHFFFMYKKERQIRNLERAKKFTHHVETWGGMNIIKKVVIDYLIERFRPLIVELANTKKCNKDIGRLADFFSTAAVAMLRNPAALSEFVRLDDNYLHQHLFPVNRVNNKSKVFKRLLQKKLAHKLHKLHPWNCEGVVYRSPVCTPDGAWYTQQGENDQSDKYPFQRLPSQTAKKYGFISARVNLQGVELNQDEHLLLPPLQKTKEEFKKILNDDALALRKEFKVVNVQKKWQVLLKEIACKSVMEVRGILYKELQHKNHTFTKIVNTLLNYCLSLLNDSFDRYIEKNNVADHIEALGFVREINWLQQLFQEIKTKRKEMENDAALNCTILTDQQIKLNQELSESISSIDLLMPLLQSMKQYCRIKTEFACGSFIQAKNYDPFVPQTHTWWQRLARYKKSIFSQPPEEVDTQFQKALQLYEKCAQKPEYTKATIELLSALITTLEEKPAKNAHEQELIVQCLLLRAITYQSQLSGNSQQLFRYQETLMDAERILKEDPVCKIALFLKISALLGMNLLDEAKNNLELFAEFYPHDQDQKMLKDRWQAIISKDQNDFEDLLSHP